jgi:hypothetical protein
MFYYSPLNIFQFGVVDPTDNDKLYAFVYDEGDGKKGGTSCFINIKIAATPRNQFDGKGGSRRGAQLYS